MTTVQNTATATDEIAPVRQPSPRSSKRVITKKVIPNSRALTVMEGQDGTRLTGLAFCRRATVWAYTGPPIAMRHSTRAHEEYLLASTVMKPKAATMLAHIMRYMADADALFQVACCRSSAKSPLQFP